MNLEPLNVSELRVPLSSGMLLYNKMLEIVKLGAESDREKSKNSSPSFGRLTQRRLIHSNIHLLFHLQNAFHLHR